MSRFKKSKTGLFFCGTEHMGEAMRTRILKVGPPMKDIVSFNHARQRARRMYPTEECEVCGFFPAQRHHKDGNPLNNDRKNISMLCPKHHVRTDRLPLLRSIAKQGGIASVIDSKRDEKGRFIRREVII